MGLCLGKETGAHKLSGGQAASGLVSGKQSSFVASIDFGTTFSGFAFCRRGVTADQIVTCTDWPGAMHVLGHPSAKTITSLLYERNKAGNYSFCEWGCPARIVYANELSRREVPQEVEAQLSKGRQPMEGQPVLVERFKLHLAEEKQGNIDPLPEGLTVERCITDYLRELGNECFRHIQLSFPGTQKADVQWCLTVPAMWSDRAKQKMKQIAVKADLTAPDSPFPVLIVLEPEAASFYSLHNLARTNGYAPTLSNYLVVDAGGGTVDLAFHQTDAKGQLTEVTASEGGLCGSTYVDARFREYLYGLPWFRDLLNSPSVSRVQKSSIIQHFRQQFERVKCAFGTRTFLGTLALPNLPKEILDVHFQHVPTNQIVLSDADMESFFKPAVDDILKLVEERLKEAPGGCGHMLLVGGFAENEYLVSRIRRCFAAELRGDEHIVRPQHPASAVLKGAVLYGLHPKRFGSRICKKTYGIRGTRPWTPDTDPGVKIFDSEGRELANDLFISYVTAGQLIPVDKCVSFDYVPVQRNQVNMQVEMWSTAEKDAKRTTEGGMALENSMTIPLEGGSGRVKVSMFFGDTAIRVVAEPSGGTMPGKSRVVQLETT